MGCHDILAAVRILLAAERLLSRHFGNRRRIVVPLRPTLPFFHGRQEVSFVGELHFAFSLARAVKWFRISSEKATELASGLVIPDNGYNHRVCDADYEHKVGSERESAIL